MINSRNVILLFGLCLFGMGIFLSTSTYCQIVTTCIGGGTGTSDVGEVASVRVFNPNGMAFDKFGNLYYANNLGHKVYKVDKDAIVSVFAGTGISGYSGDGGPATDAKLNQPCDVAIWNDTSLLITDAANNRVRIVSLTLGTINTYAGSGVSGYSGDGSNAIAAKLNMPSSVCIDANSNIYISDVGNYRIRKVDALTNIITTYAGNGLPPSSAPIENISATTTSIGVYGSIRFDNYGNLLVPEWGNCVLREINNLGIIHTIAGVYGIYTFNGDNIPATNAQFAPSFLAVDQHNYIYISDYNNNRIRIIKSDGSINTVIGNGTNTSIGDGGLASIATTSHPSGVVFDSCGNMFFGQTTNPCIRKIAFNPECFPISVPQITADAPLSIHPNPATNHLSITYTAGLQSVTITDMLGRTVLRQTFTGQHPAELPLQLSPGCYTIIVNQTPPQKLIIQ